MEAEVSMVSGEKQIVTKLPSLDSVTTPKRLRDKGLSLKKGGGSAAAGG